jgi:ribosomal protein L30E
MSKRHEKLGIKQTIQKEWMDRALRMVLAGMTEKEIRQDLDHYLSTQKQSGGVGERGQKTYGMAIGILASWFAPDDDLRRFRDEALKIARVIPEEEWLPLHWAVISAAYPFWFNVAKQVGRLFNLQESVTQVQIFNRIKEQYGDRETVARNARYTVRSFVAWGVLQESDNKGCYKKAPSPLIHDRKLAVLLFESALHATPEGAGSVAALLKHPAFFPFEFPMLSGDTIAGSSSTINLLRHGLDDEIVMLTNG